MDEILEKIPELDNKLYVIGGPRQQALGEAMTILLRTTDRCFLSTEFFCLKDSKETIEKLFDETAAACRLGKGAAPLFTTIKNGNVEAVNARICGSHGRRFVRLTFIDSLEALHRRGEKHDREDMLEAIACPNPVIAVSEEIAATGSNGGLYEVNGTKLSLTIN